MKKKEAGKPSRADATCPSCERYIGPVDECPYCGADSFMQARNRFLRYSSLLLGLVGLAFLYAMFAHSDYPMVRVRDVTPMMNFACVRVSGVVERKPYIGRNKGRPDYVSFSVHDGTGALRVMAFRNIAESLTAGERLPKAGCRVEVAGVLQVDNSGESRLRLQNATQLKITKKVVLP